MGEGKLFTVLLKHYRRSRGLSQLDLASAAEISARHLSFLETGRAKPSRDMVLRLAGTLGLGLRDVNGLLVAAGHPEKYAETALEQVSPPIRAALERMLSAQEPFPLIVFDGHYEVRMMNAAARRLLRFAMPTWDPHTPLNILRLCFDPQLGRSMIENWESVARHLLQRLARDHLLTGRESLGLLLSQMLAYPDVPQDFRTIDPNANVDPVFDLHFRVHGASMRFLTTLTSFDMPRHVLLDELRIESYFPLDEETRQLCEQLARMEDGRA
ncbi:MAG: helix-turn-helix domain-containing protein [Myxococcales bacterium]